MNWYTAFIIMIANATRPGSLPPGIFFRITEDNFVRITEDNNSRITE